MKFMLEVPWGFKYEGLKSVGSGLHQYTGPLLPKALRPYASKDFSYARWREDEDNAIVQQPERGSGSFKPKTHQLEAAQKIVASYNNGWRGYLQADSTGLGKGLKGSTKIPTVNGFTTMNDLQVGDIIFTPSGKTTRVIEKHISKAKKFYKITFSDGTIVYADSDHRWLTQNSVERARENNNTVPQRKISEDEEEKLLNYLKYAQENKLGITIKECCEESGISKDLIREIVHGLDYYGIFNKQRLYHPQEVLESCSKYEIIRSNRWGGNYERESVRDTEELLNNLYVGSGRRNYSIRVTEPIQGEHQELPIDPYILGVWIGDGGSYHCEITSMDEEIIDEVIKKYPLRKKVNQQNNNSSMYYFDNLNSDIHKLFEAKYHTKITKKIHQIYLNASIDQRMDLLAGLLDTDGSISQGSGTGVSFCQKNKELFFQVYTLICSLGWKATYRTKKVFIETSKKYETYYELNFYPNKQVFRLSRKADILSQKIESFKNNKKSKLRYITLIEEVEKDDEYYCISVDSPEHLFLITESYIPTHNTLSTLAGISAIAKREGFGVKNKGLLLIVCPKSVIPHWRNTIHNYPVSSAFLRVMIINYQQLNKLLTAPPNARVGKKKTTKNRQKARKGTPTINWNYIIFDEAHYLKNYPKSAVSMLASNVAQLEKPYVKNVSPFVVYATATPGATPLNLSIMAGIIAPLIDEKGNNVTPSSWGEFLYKHGFAVTKGSNGWIWASPPWKTKGTDEDPEKKRKYDIDVAKTRKLQRRDSQRIGRSLLKKEAPFIKRSPKDIAGWPEQQVIPLPITLDYKQRPYYEEAWTRFRNFLNLAPARRDPKTSLVENLRYRQKASLLKVDSATDFIVDMVESGNQVYVSCEFIETIERYKENLSKKKIRVGEISGRNVEERNAIRQQFQRGEIDVVLCTVVEGISLHSGETLSDGTKATSATRVTVIHDVRQNSLANMQALGRAHRDGENSVAYFPYIENSVDEKIIESYTNKTSNMNSMMGEELESAEMYERIFREAAARTTPPNRLS